ncbi:MAG TPA: flagellar hook-associated protein FlgK [Burkholderiales bacterium]|nr:flagellar hook-associated protein FlgK [Burkholderiales bacterium]
MASSLFGIGISGLNNAQASLLTTSHNISNVNTPGYSRQVVVQATNTPQYTGAGFFGSGAHIETVQRQYNNFLEVQARETQSATSELQRYGRQISRIDELFADTTSGLSSAIDDFFKGVQEVAAQPAGAASRQSMLSAANALVARFQLLNKQLNDSRTDVNSQITANVDTINSIASRIAELNDKIIVVSAQGGGSQPPNDLLDQRDVLVRDLNKLVKANVVQQSDGSYNVFIGNGQGLVVRNDAYRLAVVEDPASPADKQLALNTGTALVRLRSQDIVGGELGGLFSYRDETLNTTQNALGRIAMVMAENFNAQHNLGQTLTGAMGGDFFGLATPQVIPNANNAVGGTATATITDYSALTSSDYRLRYDGSNYQITRLPENTTQSFATMPQTVDGVTFTAAGLTAGDSFLIQPTRDGANALNVLVTDTSDIAAASPIRSNASLSNAGTGTISAGQVNGLPLTGNNYSISFAAGAPMTYTVTNTTTAAVVVAATAYTPGADITFDNITVAVSGNPAAGDSFTIGPNTNGSGDNRNALALAGLQTEDVLGGMTLQGAYAQLISTIGNKTREVQINGEAQGSLLKETEAARESVSGVNLDEEAANLIRYQQAYQAASQVISIAGSMFDSILEIMR